MGIIFEQHKRDKQGDGWEISMKRSYIYALALLIESALILGWCVISRQDDKEPTILRRQIVPLRVYITDLVIPDLNWSRNRMLLEFSGVVSFSVDISKSEFDIDNSKSKIAINKLKTPELSEANIKKACKIRGEGGTWYGKEYNDILDESQKKEEGDMKDYVAKNAELLQLARSNTESILRGFYARQGVQSVSIEWSND